MGKPARITAALGLLAAVLAACQGLDFRLLPGTAAAPTSTAPAPTLIAPPTPTPLVVGAEETGEPALTVLTIWMAEALSPSAETPGGQQLLEQLAAFEEGNPDIRVEVYPKLATGPGSTLAYLRSAPTVAPGVLPDLALLDREALFQAARENLIVPMDGLVDPAILDNLYPAALLLGAVGEQLVGVPYVLQVQHLAYREAIFEDPPNSFEAILDSPVSYIFPAGTASNVNQTILAQYIAAGGSLTGPDGTPLLDAAALTEVLEFYASARERGVIDPSLFQITDLDESWEQYLSRQAGLAAVTSTAYLAERAAVRGTGVTWLPTPDGQPFALATGWLWVVTTSNPTRQAAAMALFNFLMNPVNQGTLTQAAGWLPSQPGALAVWGDADRYANFGDLLLRSAVPVPEPGIRGTVGVAIQEALEDVLIGGVPPQQAAADAALRVNPPELGEP